MLQQSEVMQNQVTAVPERCTKDTSYTTENALGKKPGMGVVLHILGLRCNIFLQQRKTFNFQLDTGLIPT